jgi:hypothetical protein
MKPFQNAGNQLSRSHSPTYRTTVKRLTGLCVLCLLYVIVFQVAPTTEAKQASVVDSPVEWLTGKSLDEYLTTLNSVTWVEAPIKARLTAFSRSQRVAIFLDRRIDPSTKINIRVKDITFELFLAEIASQNNWSVCRLDNFFYLGPKPTTCRLPIIWKQMKTESSKRRRAHKVDWVSAETFSLPQLSPPGEALAALAGKHRFQFEGIDVPHDLWSATELPEVSLDGQVALLLTGFNKWFERSDDGRTINIIDFPMIETGKYEFPSTENAKAIHRKLKKDFRDCRISLRGKSLVASGSPPQLAEVRHAFLRLSQPQPAESGEKTLTLTAKASRIAILKKVAQDTGNQLIYSPELERTLNEQVSVSVNKASLGELLEAVLKEANLSFQLGGGRLEITD